MVFLFFSSGKFLHLSRTFFVICLFFIQREFGILHVLLFRVFPCGVDNIYLDKNNNIF